MIEILFDVKYHSLEFTGNNTRNTKKALSNNIIISYSIIIDMSKRYDYIPSLDFDNIRHDISNSNQYSRESQYPLANHLFYEEQNRSKKVLTTLNTI